MESRSNLQIYTGPYQYDYPEILQTRSAEFPGEDLFCGYIQDQEICPGKLALPVGMPEKLFRGKLFRQSGFFLYFPKESVYYPL